MTITNYPQTEPRLPSKAEKLGVRNPMNSLEKSLSILGLFTDDASTISPEDVENLTGVSRASAYRYIQALVDVGLIAQIASGVYGLGARILELDRLHRNSDHLLAAARTIMDRYSQRRGVNMILSRYYGDRVVCSHTAWPNPNLTQIYERGRPLPLFYGAMAKVILANLSTYQLRALMLKHMDDIRMAGLGGDWKEFRGTMMRLRKQGSCITHAEITPESVGVAAPLFDTNGHVTGSIAYAVPRDEFEQIDEASLRQEIIDAAAEIGARLKQITGRAEPASPPIEP